MSTKGGYTAPEPSRPAAPESETPEIGLAPPLPVSLLTISAGKVLVTIRPDGTLEYGEGYTPDAAAQAFWNAVADHSLQRRLSLAQTEIKGHMRVEDELRRDLEQGFMQGAYARLKNLQNAERQLAQAQVRIAELEKELETLRGKHGSA